MKKIEKKIKKTQDRTVQYKDFTYLELIEIIGNSNMAKQHKIHFGYLLGMMTIYKDNNRIIRNILSDCFTRE